MLWLLFWRMLLMWLLLLVKCIYSTNTMIVECGPLLYWWYARSLNMISLLRFILCNLCFRCLLDIGLCVGETGSYRVVSYSSMSITICCCSLACTCLVCCYFAVFSFLTNACWLHFFWAECLIRNNLSTSER